MHGLGFKNSHKSADLVVDVAGVAFGFESLLRSEVFRVQRLHTNLEHVVCHEGGFCLGLFEEKFACLSAKHLF